MEFALREEGAHSEEAAAHKTRKPAFDLPLARGLGETKRTKPVEPRGEKRTRSAPQPPPGGSSIVALSGAECNEPKAGCHELLIWIFWGRTGAPGCAARCPGPNGPRRLCANSSEIGPKERLGALGGRNGAPAG